MVLSNVQILEALDSGDIVFDPDIDRESQVEPASVDLPIGHVLKTQPEIRAEGLTPEGPPVIIAPHEFIQVRTHHSIALTAHLSGRIGISSSFARKGLLLFAGHQIDPGWRGRLVVPLFNATSAPLPLTFNDLLVSIEFHRLAVPANPAYGAKPKHRKGQDSFRPEEIAYVQAAGMSYAGLVQLVRDTRTEMHTIQNELNGKLDRISGQLSNIMWVGGIVTGTGFTIVGGLAIAAIFV